MNWSLAWGFCFCDSSRSHQQGSRNRLNSMGITMVGGGLGRVGFEEGVGAQINFDPWNKTVFCSDPEASHHNAKVPSKIVFPCPMAEAGRADKVQNFAERHWAESGPGRSGDFGGCVRLCGLWPFQKCPVETMGGERNPAPKVSVTCEMLNKSKRVPEIPTWGLSL